GVGVSLGSDRGDLVPFDEDVALRQIAEVGIHGQDGAATQQEPVGHWNSSSLKSHLVSGGAYLASSEAEQALYTPVHERRRPRGQPARGTPAPGPVAAGDGP